MLAPKRVKFRKMFKGRTRGVATRGSEISFGSYGLQALEPVWLTSRQIDASPIVFPDASEFAEEVGESRPSPA